MHKGHYGRTSTEDDGLTSRQREILDFISRATTETGHPPTVREIGSEFGIGSPNGVVAHLRSMKSKGFIDWTPAQSRSLRVLKGGPAPCPYCNGTGHATITGENP